MAMDTPVEGRARFECFGVDAEGKNVLSSPEAVAVDFVQREGNTTSFTGNVRCSYIAGGHGQRCRASHPDSAKVGDGVSCPFTFDYPYVKNNNPDWICPSKLWQVFDFMMEHIDPE